jgi:uncharacterized protein (TIGR02444 family)
MHNNKSFWNFSVRTYKNEGVSTICLNLQDAYGVDVNQMFFCCWYGYVAGEFTDTLFDRSIEFSKTWAQEVVNPLRSVRQWMKPLIGKDERLPDDDATQLREMIKKAELLAEKLQEETLESLVGELTESSHTHSEQVEASAKNIKRYFTLLNIELNDAVINDVNAILSAAYSE